MRLLLVHPGAAWSTHDVYEGLLEGLRRHGAEVHPYGLFGRVRAADRWMHYLWRKGRKENAAIEKPSWPDVVYHASTGVLERALRLEVDAVLVVSGMYFHPDAMILCRRAGIRTATLFTESPYQIEQELRFAALSDLVWTTERTVVPAFQRAVPGGRAFYLPHAWRPSVHGPDVEVPAGTPAREVVFVGSGFPERIRMLEAVNWRGVDLGLYGHWREVRKRSPLAPAVVPGAVPNAITAALYRNAAVGLNLFRAAGGAESMNPRLLELAACGCFIVSEYRAEVVEKFGDAVPVFRTPAQLEALVRRWVPDVDGRRAVAARLPAIVAEDSWLVRAGRILGDLEALVGRRAA